MPEQRMLITPEEQPQRNRLLRQKKNSQKMLAVFLSLIGMVIFYFLYKSYRQDSEIYYLIPALLALFLFCAFYLYKYSVRPIDLDLKSNEKIITTGTTILYGPLSARSGIHLLIDVDGKCFDFDLLEIVMITKKVWPRDYAKAGDQFQLEFTPYGRYLTSIEKL